MVETATVIYSHGHRTQMGMEWWVNDTVGKLMCLEKYMLECHFAQHNPHMNCPWI